MVSRLSNPYGDCRDPNDIDKSQNAYAEYFPVVYSAQVGVYVICTYVMSVNVVTVGVDLAGILGGCMTSAEDGSVPSGMGYGRSVPSPAD